MSPKDPPFTGYIYTESDLKPTAEFTEALAIISTTKGWKKWSKVISKKVYDRIHDDAWQCIATFGIANPEKTFNDFMRDLVEYYLDHGTLKPDTQYYHWEMGLFAMFKRRIDEAIVRRVRAIRAAQIRRQRKGEEKSEVIVMSDEVGATEQPQNPQNPATTGSNSGITQPQNPQSPAMGGTNPSDMRSKQRISRKIKKKLKRTAALSESLKGIQP